MVTSRELSLDEPNERDCLTVNRPKQPYVTSQERHQPADQDIESEILSDSESRGSSALSAGFFVLGVGCLLPFNALLLVIDYYTLLFPRLLIAQYVTNAYTFPFLISGILLASFPLPSFLRSSAVFFSYSMLTLVSALYPLLTTRDEPFLSESSSIASLQFLSAVALTIILGLVNALVQTILFGIVALLPNRACTTAYNSGGAAASVLLVLMRVVSRFIFDQGDNTDPSALRPGFTLFFFACSSLSFCCIIVFFWIYSRSLDYKLYISTPQTEDSPMQSYGHPHSSNERSHFMRTAMLTLSDIRVESFSMVSCFVITLMLFPGVMTVPPKPMQDNTLASWSSWFPLYVVAVFAIGDIVGRSLWSEKIAVHHPKTLPYIAASRLLFIPAVILEWKGPFPTTSFSSLTTVFLLAVTNGFVMNMAFLIAPTKTTSGRREAAGRFMFLMLNLGLSLGTACGWLLQSFLTKI